MLSVDVSLPTSSRLTELTPISSPSGHPHIWRIISLSAFKTWKSLSVARYLSLIIMAPKLFKHLAATVFGEIFDWLGILIAPMINDALSLRWALPTYLAFMASITTMVDLVLGNSMPWGTHGAGRPKTRTQTSRDFLATHGRVPTTC